MRARLLLLIATGSLCVGFTNGDAAQSISRDLRLSAIPRLVYRASGPGDIRVHGWNGRDMRIKVTIGANASATSARTRPGADEFDVVVRDGVLQTVPTRPSISTVSGTIDYELWVPEQTGLDLHTTSGLIAVDHVEGDIVLDAAQGHLFLMDLAGRVDAVTRNGIVDVGFSGPTWRGSGFAARSGNGDIRIRVPETYAARFHALTQNGIVFARHPLDHPDGTRSRSSWSFGSTGPAISLQTGNGNIILNDTDD